MKLIFNQSLIHQNSFCSIKVSSTKQSIYNSLSIEDTQLGLYINAFVVDNLQCLIIDTSLVKKLNLQFYLDDNDNPITIELEDDLGNSIDSSKAYELNIHFQINNTEIIKKAICIEMDIKKSYDVDMLYGKGTVLKEY